MRPARPLRKAGAAVLAVAVMAGAVGVAAADPAPPPVAVPPAADPGAGAGPADATPPAAWQLADQLSEASTVAARLAAERDALEAQLADARTAADAALVAEAAATARLASATVAWQHATDVAERSAAASYVFTGDAGTTKLSSVLGGVDPSKALGDDVTLGAFGDRVADELAAATRERDAASDAVDAAVRDRTRLTGVAAQLTARHQLVSSQLAAAEARKGVLINQVATAAAGMSATVGLDGCVTSAPAGSFPDGVDVHALCVASVAAARTPEAAGAIKFAFGALGSPYSQPLRMQPGVFDCSSLVMRAYEAAGARTVSVGGSGWAPTTWAILAAPWATPIGIAEARPGDLVFPSDGHVAMLLADGWMLHTTNPSVPARIARAYTAPFAVRAIDPSRLVGL